jgi:hypothetical protein
VAASSAASQPLTPNSPPELPTSTLPSATSGAMVIVSPLSMLASRVRQISLPDAASSAIASPSRVLKKIRPSA